MRLRVVTKIASVVAILTLVLAVSQPADSARAVGNEVFDNGYLRVTSFVTPGMTQMQVGEPTDWQMSLEPLVAGSGTVSVGFALVSDPYLASDLSVEVLACTVQWVNGSCAGSASSWSGPSPVATAFEPLDLGGVAHLVATVPVTNPLQTTWIVLRITPQIALQGSAMAQFLIAMEGQGTPIVIRPGPYSLAKTGVESPITLLWVTAVLLAFGGLLVAGSRRRANARPTFRFVEEQS